VREEDHPLKQTLILLAELQAVDTRIKTLENARETLFAKQKTLQVDVDKLRGEFKVLSQKVEELEKEKRAKEMELQGERDKLKKWEGRLEDLRNTREYEALQREVGGLKRAITELGEAIDARQTALDEANKLCKAVAEKLSRSELDLKEETGNAKTAASDREGAVKTEKETRVRLAEKLPANLKKKYDALLVKRGNLAVVPARDGVCKGCSMGLPAQQYIRVQRGETVEECPACKRMLFFEALLDRTAAQAAAH
jgi:predicted  nucleic acid-binding Zn-ribbon protein